MPGHYGTPHWICPTTETYVYSLYLSSPNPDFKHHVMVGVVKWHPVVAAVKSTVEAEEPVVMIIRKNVQLNITNGVNLPFFLLC